MFLTASDLKILTGRSHKSGQIDQLRKMGIPYFVNAAGCPVVTQSAIEGRKSDTAPATWRPAALGT